MPEVTTTLTQQITDLIANINTRDATFRDWISGTTDGGPNNDGNYPLADAHGKTYSVPCPARLADMVSGPAAISEAAKTGAHAALAAAISRATEATDAKTLAEAAKGAAIAARDLAQTHRSHAATHEATARYWAEQAKGQGVDVTGMFETVTELSQQVAADAVQAEAAAGSAATSAALAAHFEPNNFDKKSDPIAANRITGTISISNLPALPGADAYFSTGGFANISAADQTAIKTGDYVTLSDGRRWQYRGGTKTAQASYVYITDDTPDWNTLANLPTTFLPSPHSHSHTDINGFTWANLNSKPTTFTPSAHTHAWAEINGIPSTFTPSAHGHAMSDISGLVAALDLKAPKANASFSTAISVNGAVGAQSFAANHSLFYPDGNHTVVKTGPGGQERYWRFDANGTLYSLNGGIYSNYDVQAMGSITVGTSNGANRVNVEKGWLELRNDGYGPYVDFSLDATADFHARISVPKTDGRLWMSHAGGGSLIVGPTIEANASNGSQAGSVITHAGAEQVMAKQLTFLSAQNPQDSAAGAFLEVRGQGGGYGAWMKFHRPGAYGTYFGMFEDGKWGFGGWSSGATIHEFWTTKNLDANDLMRRYNDGWVQTRDSNDRFYFASNGRSYYKSRDGHQFRGGADNNLMTLDSGGTMDLSGTLHVRGNDITLYGGSPTIRLVDSDNRSAHIHVNSNRFYVLRGSGVGSTGWESINDGWPLELNLDNGDLNTSGQVFAGNNCYFRVRQNGGYYFETHGGGIYMIDATWLRVLGDKNIVTGGQVQMGSFTVTSDRRLKTDIKPIPLAQASQIIDDTNVYEFTKGGRRMFGMIAQEAQEVAPILVSEGADLHEDGGAILSLDQTGYIPVMIAELRSLRQRVAQLEGTIH